MRSARNNNRQNRIRSTAPYNRNMSVTSNRGTRVYVGNLSWNVQWKDLKDHMRQAGNVIHVDVMGEPSGRSKGCAIVEYATPHEAQSAIASMNDTELDGRLIFVREDRETGGGGGNAPPNGSVSGSTNGSVVYVGNLSWQVKWQDLKDHFKQVGHVLHADIMEDHNGRSKGCGLVEFSTPDEAQAAISDLSDTELMGRLIFVREDRVGGGQVGGAPQHASHGREVQYQGAQDGLNMGYPAALATERPAPGGAVGGDGSFNIDSGKGSTRLYVGNLAWSVRWQDLKDHFKATLPNCGNIRVDVIMENGPSNRSKGFGIVEFDTVHEAEVAVQTMNNTELHERAIFVRYDRDVNGRRSNRRDVR